MRPRILITTDVGLNEHGRARATAYLSYIEAVRRAGGVPLLAPPVASEIDEILPLVHGIVVPGGNDFDPELLGEAGHPSIVLMDRRRQETDLAIVRAAVVRDIPYLGICLGMQMLGLATGGRIMQDIPTMHPDPLEHQSDPAKRVRHPVSIIEGTRLAALTGGGGGEVNSSHHQAVSSVGPRAVVAATAPDGIIEAIELPESLFCLGVQWHPEDMPEEPLGETLFAGLVEAAVRYATKPRVGGGVT